MSEPMVLGGRYELAEVIGRGGMAEVRRGRDLRLGRSVAVKMLRTDLAREATFQGRFRREAQSAASLNHPAIVAVYDTGEDVVAGASVPFIVMEYVEGTTLRDLITSGRRLLPERALEITRGVLAALDYSHRNGIVHRDIKPANVMLTPDGAVKVMDFGIARALADESATMTQASAVMGTAKYLSPEQARGEQVDARTDLYSTGCLLYELLTGRPPFDGDNMVSVAYQHVGEEAAPPSSLDPEIPPGVDAVVMKALAKPREDRYQSAAEMGADIERLLAGLPVNALPVRRAPALMEQTTRMSPVGSGVLPTSRYTDERPAPAPAPERRRGAAGWVTLVVAVLAVFVLAVVAARALTSGGSASSTVQVPDLRGKTAVEASQQLATDGLTLGNQTEREDPATPGTVIDQSPSTGTGVERATKVDVVLSAGAAKARVPRLIGLSQEDAQNALTDAKLTLGPVRPQDSQEKAGQVLSQEPAPNTEVAASTPVSVVVSSGRSAVPDVRTQLLAQARAALSTQGFTSITVLDREVTNQALVGTVLDQAPGGGTVAAPTTPVTLTVGVAAPPPTTPAPPPPSTPAPQPSGPAPSP